ncbi:hypothetical protein [Nostoc sp.]
MTDVVQIHENYCNREIISERSPKLLPTDDLFSLINSIVAINN